jgi:hypothetical protein
VSYEPRWDVDRAYGEQGERALRNVLALTEDRFEVKRKRRHDDGLYIELEQDRGPTGQWKASGLRTSQADYFVYLVDNTGIMLFLPTGLLRRAVTRGLGRPAREYNGDCPTRGRLIRFGRLVTE